MHCAWTHHGANNLVSLSKYIATIVSQQCAVFIHRLIFQKLQFSNRLMTIMGLIISIIAYTLLGDWQAVKYDPCIEHSLFHHHELLQQYMTQLNLPVAHENIFVAEILQNNISHQFPCMVNHLANIDIYVLPNIKEVDLTPRCGLVQSCPLCVQQDVNRIYSISPTCMHLSVDFARQQILLSREQLNNEHQNTFSYSCAKFRSPLELCVHISTVSDTTQCSTLEDYVANVHVQMVQVLENRLVTVAENECEDQFDHSCHWNPHSTITHKYCRDCPPICRHKNNYLMFSQFTIGALLLVMCAQLVHIPIISMLSDIVDKDLQVS